MICYRPSAADTTYNTLHPLTAAMVVPSASQGVNADMISALRNKDKVR